MDQISYFLSGMDCILDSKQKKTLGWGIPSERLFYVLRPCYHDYYLEQ